MNSYKTLLNNGSHQIEIKGSRFICHLQRATNEEEAQQFIQLIKKEHWKATHNCSAFLIGEQSELQRANDDGEPSGTAGVPMLEVLKKNELHDVVAVVTRYFGGTKLGASGLIRAYTQSVASALQELGIALCRLEERIALTVSYAHVGKLEYYLIQEAVTIVDKQYAEQVTVLCSIPVEQAPAFQQAVIDLLNNQIDLQTHERVWVETPYVS